MLNPAEEFENLMQGVRAGDQEAARKLFKLYGKQIQIVVRSRLSQPLRSRFDSVDFAQDVWASFFHLPPERITFRTPQELVAFLARLAQHRLIEEFRKRHWTTEYNQSGVETLKEECSEEPPSRHPTPSQFAIADEQWRLLLHNIPPGIRHALEMLRDGHSHREIAERLGIHPKKIQRLLNRLQDKLKSP
jgi:RNA polymerase sigma-70 factor (ECF subfamily)